MTSAICALTPFLIAGTLIFVTPSIGHAQQDSLRDLPLTTRLTPPALVTLLATDGASWRDTAEACSPSARNSCRRAVVAGAMGGFVAGFGLSLMYGLVVCLPKSFRDGEGCSGAVPVIFTLGGAAAGATLALFSARCK